jgi:hypothetical protein
MKTARSVVRLTEYVPGKTCSLPISFAPPCPSGMVGKSRTE